MSSLAPIAVFAFNRPQHLERTLEALAACPEASRSALTIYCDGPRHDADEVPVQGVRAVARRASGFLSLDVVASEVNRGLAASIVSGIGEQLSVSDRVVVVEDDLVVSPYFLRFMNEGLDMYASDDLVASIHGYTYAVADTLPETFFLRGADCWGWATWARAWRHFRSDGTALLADLRAQRLTHRFDLDGAYPYTRMLEDQIAGRNNSWAVRWHASCFLRSMLTLYPCRSLVVNIGHDDSGTHSGSTDAFDVELLQRPVNMQRVALAESPEATAAVAAYFRRHHGRWHRFAQRIRRLLPRRALVAARTGPA
jgi:hypothetical protein